MKKTLATISWVVCVALCSACTSTAQSTSGLGTLLSGKSSDKTSTTTTTTSTEKENTQSSSSSSIGSLLNMLGGSTTSGNSTTTTTTTTPATTTDNTQGTSSSSGIGSLLNMLGGSSTSSDNTSTGTGDAITSALGSILGSVVAANTELTVASLEGTWVYTAPACKFKSEDLLKSAGGDVAASQISQQLAPTYAKLGFNEQYNYVFDAEGGFVMTVKKLPISGTAAKAAEKGYFTFEFVKLGTYALATTPVYVEVVGDKMLLLFEADKFIAMFKSVVGKLGITTLNSVFDLVESYDGVLIGFELTK